MKINNNFYFQTLLYYINIISENCIKTEKSNKFNLFLFFISIKLKLF